MPRTADYNEVKTLGSLTGSSRTPEQTAVARFYVENAIVMLNRTFRTIAENKGLTPVEEARLFGMLNLTGADAAHQLLGRQGPLRLLAADHSDPPGR